MCALYISGVKEFLRVKTSFEASRAWGWLSSYKLTYNENRFIYSFCYIGMYRIITCKYILEEILSYWTQILQLEREK